jgi:hypothetical protein
MNQVTIDTFIAGLNPNTQMTVDALRDIIASSHDGLLEGIKWNGPSFSLNSEHRITLGLTRSGAVQVVIHRGAKPKDVTNFAFGDTAGLARWPAKDRGVLIFENVAEVSSKSDALRSLFHEWIKATI